VDTLATVQYGVLQMELLHELLKMELLQELLQMELPPQFITGAWGKRRFSGSALLGLTGSSRF
jgi:hypothetical protein